ncbi:MAG: protein kinase [Bdellovibrionales bacterium]|nr:protein kinase [Bdellovibrionales bacterium]
MPGVEVALSENLLFSRYRVVDRLASGSTGTIYLCEHQDFPGRLIAVKILSSEVARDPIVQKRFQNEIVASYDIDHPNVIRAFDYIREKELLGYSMEYIDGGDLRDLLEEQTRLSVDDSLDILIQICDGIAAIHRAGIIHRDLKPENILLTRTGQVKISDFGIAHFVGGSKLTAAGAIVGTLDYVSPEYLSTGELSTRCDIYGVGVLAYQMLTGEIPLEGSSVIDSLRRRVHEDAPRPSSINSEIPPALDDIVVRALARRPEERFSSALAMRDALIAVQAERHTPSLSAAPATAKQAGSSWLQSMGRLVRSALMLLLSVAAGFAVVFVSYELAQDLSWRPNLGSIHTTANSLLRRSSPVTASEPAPRRGSLSNATAAPTDPPAGLTHTIRTPGESLSVIAAWYTGDYRNWKQLAKHNGDIDPRNLELGQSVIIPEKLLITSEPLTPELLRSVTQKIRARRD